MRVILLCSQAFDVLLQRSTSGIRLLSAPEAAGQNGDTYPDLELCTALLSGSGCYHKRRATGG